MERALRRTLKERAPTGRFTSIIDLQPKLDLPRNIALARVAAGIVCSYDRAILVPARALAKDCAVKNVQEVRAELDTDPLIDNRALDD